MEQSDQIQLWDRDKPFQIQRFPINHVPKTRSFQVPQAFRVDQCASNQGGSCRALGF